jgi:hypothetical protein
MVVAARQVSNGNLQKTSPLSSDYTRDRYGGVTQLNWIKTADERVKDTTERSVID